MFTQKRVLAVISMILAAAFVLGACTTPTPQTIIQTQVVTQEVFVTQEVPLVVTQIVTQTQNITTTVPAVAETEAVTRQGSWLDQVVFVEQNSAEAAVSQLQAGDIDIYAYSVNNVDVFETVQADPNLAYINSFGSKTDLTFNPTVCSDTAKLNPFSNPKVREAMHWAIDRNYIVQEIYGGLAVAKFTQLTSAFPDYARYAPTVRALEAKYAYNLDKAKEVFTAELEGMGATVVDGKFQFGGSPITIIVLIRTEDERRQIGDYISTQLEELGFTVDRQYKTRSEASPIWVQGNPTDCLFNVYTGGWITTAVSRDEGSNFSFYYTPNDYPIPLFQAYTPTDEFNQLALDLRNNNFNNMEERDAMFEKALPLAMEDNVRMWLVDQKSFSPFRKDLHVAYDLAGGVSGTQLWPHTMRYDAPGGIAKISQPGIMVDPWNAVGGSNWIYDTMPIRGTGDFGAVYDPYTGLAWPQRIEKAEVLAQDGLPIIKTLDWVTLDFTPEIQVPADAWADWDATAQKFITVGEKYTSTVIAKTKITVYYPDDLYTTVKWHDGSSISAADFVMNMITTFDTGKEESPLYDAAAAETLAAFQAHFVAVKIVSTDPLVIETYDNLYQLDAELNAYGNTWFPMYTYGPASWHALVPGILAETNGELAFSSAKAEEKQVEWMSYISGPSLAILKADLDKAQADKYIPYAATLSDYITPEEADARYTNLQNWYANKGHFWVGTGAFYLDQVFPVEGTLTLRHNPNYPDMADKWSRFGTPKIAVAEVEGPGNVTIGQEAAFDVYVSFQDQPYPASELSAVNYLVFNAQGDLVAQGPAELVSDGQYKITLSADVTKGLEAGSNRLEVAISSLVVSVPTFTSYEFVTAP